MRPDFGMTPSSLSPLPMGEGGAKRRVREAHLGNESGMTLVIVIVLAAAALIVMAGLIYMVTSGTELTGTARRYSTALEAAVGGVDATAGLINLNSATNFSLQNAGINGGAPISSIANATCVNTKLTQPTANWTANGCPANTSTSWIIDPTNSKTYDMTVTLGNYTVYSKIVDTIQGNTAQAQGLVQTGVVQANSGQDAVTAIPYIYTINVLSIGPASERSKVSAVYEY